ncbi:MAG: hypothetical protein IJY62_03410 [Clostridia bacterium]|nr:hypothetical protein [Clostridia bacterium]
MNRVVRLKPTDYISFNATGKFKVEIGKADALYGTIILPEQNYTGETVTVAVPSDVVTEEGEYKIFVYAVGANGVTQTVSELFILSSETEDVHTYEVGGT